MVQIVETEVALEPPIGTHLHCLVAQLPNDLHKVDGYVSVARPVEQWRMVSSVLELVASGEGNLSKVHFLVLPEAVVPAARFDYVLDIVASRFRTNTVTTFGVEHVSLARYRQLLRRFRDDCGEALELVERDVAAGESLERPVNWCCVAVKEASRLRVFLEAKTHPFSGEELVDRSRDLYQGGHLYLFRARPACFNFMVLICFDYLYRDVYGSNLRQILDHAGKLYLRTRQSLDALFVVQCDPKPDHSAWRDALSGFYGEYLEDTPGVRGTVTVFGNCSGQTRLEGYREGSGFGCTSVVIGRRHKLAHMALPELTTDDFGGAPVCRLRFGTATRLYLFHVELHHEADPRSSRVPLKVHSIFRPLDGGWQRVSADEMVEGFDSGQR